MRQLSDCALSYDTNCQLGGDERLAAAMASKGAKLMPRCALSATLVCIAVTGASDAGMAQPHAPGVRDAVQRDGRARHRERRRDAKHSSGERRFTIRAVPPLPVRRADGRTLQTFYLGRRVASEAACAACHRIGDSGDAGPGRSLTHVGSHLSQKEIRRAIVDAKYPMPAFGNLSRQKIRALVRFLALLR